MAFLGVGSDDLAQTLLYDVTASAPNRPAYGLHEWQEEEGWHAVVQAKFNHIIEHHLNVNTFSEEELIADRNKPISDKLALEDLIKTLPIHSDSHLQVDCNGKPLAMFMKGGLAWPWSQERATDVVRLPFEATLALTKAYPPPMIKDGNKRHPDSKAERQECDRLGQPHGVYYLGARRPDGQRIQQPAITTDSWPNTEKGEAVNKYFQKLAPVDQTLGMLFEAFNKPLYDSYRLMYDHWADRSSLAGLKRTARACWSYRAVLVNAKVAAHRDDLDLQGGMVAMLCGGDFEGGRLLLPALGIQYEFQPSDVMLCKASYLEHAIGPWKGQRVSFVNTWKQDMTNLNAAVLPPTLSKRREQAAVRIVKYAADEAKGILHTCPFCNRPQAKLKTHLKPWLVEPPKAENREHTIKEVREFAKKQWGA